MLPIVLHCPLRGLRRKFRHKTTTPSVVSVRTLALAQAMGSDHPPWVVKPLSIHKGTRLVQSFVLP